MPIPIEILILWERYYHHGDYTRIAKLCNITPHQLVNYIHSAEMPEDVLRVFTEYYQVKEATLQTNK